MNRKSKKTLAAAMDNFDKQIDVKKAKAEQQQEANERLRARADAFLDKAVLPEAQALGVVLRERGHAVRITDQARDDSSERRVLVRIVPRPFVDLPNEQAVSLQLMFFCELATGDMVVQGPVGTERARIAREAFASVTAEEEVAAVLVEAAGDALSV